jgi:hypothetical protein
VIVSVDQRLGGGVQGRGNSHRTSETIHGTQRQNAEDVRCVDEQACDGSQRTVASTDDHQGRLITEPPRNGTTHPRAGNRVVRDIEVRGLQPLHEVQNLLARQRGSPSSYVDDNQTPRRVEPRRRTHGSTNRGGINGGF